MTDDGAFLQAIQERPDDFLIRLVYADWLEERGDDRHRLIRVEEAMRPHKLWDDQYQRLKPQRNHLRKQFSGEWLNAMGYAPVHRPMFGEMPPTADARWRLAEEFIDIWHGELRPGDGYTGEELDATEQRLGFPLPKALREWYGLGGKRRDVWSTQDRLVLPTLRDGRVVVRFENQGVTNWYIRREDMALPDPPVYGGDVNRMVAESVSAFALFVVVYESQFRHIWSEVGSPAEATTHDMPDRFRLTALPRWYWFPEEVHVWEAIDSIIIHMGMVYATCRTEAAYDQLVADFGDRVERFD